VLVYWDRLLAALGATSFALAFFAGRQREQPQSQPRGQVTRETTDSARLAAVGIRPGPQLVAYVFGSSRCGYCQRSDTKQAFSSIKRTLVQEYGNQFPTIMVVGVAVNTDLQEGLAYLSSMGLNNFDEISVGDGWRNEHVTRFIRRERIAEAAVPLVVVLTRSMTARAQPVSLTFSPDSVECCNKNSHIPGGHCSTQCTIYAT